MVIMETFGLQGKDAKPSPRSKACFILRRHSRDGLIAFVRSGGQRRDHRGALTCPQEM
jgi:hypothetical protein